RSTPAACQAGAYGMHGGATSTTVPPAAVSRARVGSSRDSSPTPSAGSSNSVSARRGQPPCGRVASSAGYPLGSPLAGRRAPRPACQSVREASRLSIAATWAISTPPHQAAVDALDGELLPGTDLDRGMRRIARQQADGIGTTLQALDGQLAIDPCHHGLA